MLQRDGSPTYRLCTSAVKPSTYPGCTGSTVAVCDSAGSVIATYTHDAFGAVRSHTGAGTEWTFTGERNDPNGIEYLRARYYDPAGGGSWRATCLAAGTPMRGNPVKMRGTTP